jgi:hypothetical protein
VDVDEEEEEEYDSRGEWKRNARCTQPQAAQCETVRRAGFAVWHGGRRAEVRAEAERWEEKRMSSPVGVWYAVGEVGCAN